MHIRQKMKIVIFITALFFSVSKAYAEDTGISWSLGLKGWSNSWEEKFSGETIKSDSSVLMLGPSLSIRKDQIFGSLSYITSSSDYKFSDVGSSDITLSYKRNDLDVIGGYMLHPRFGIFIGYKSLIADGTISSSRVINATGTSTSKLTGPGIGITGNYPFEDMPFALYGSIGLMSLESKNDTEITLTTPATFFTVSSVSRSSSSTSNNVKGAVIEVGASYRFTDNLSANLGIKSQSFSGGDAEDTFSGFTLGANYSF